DADGQIAEADPLRGPHQPADRIAELGGEMNAYRDRRSEKQQRNEDVDDSERDLKPGTLTFEALILRRRKVNLVAMRQHPRFDKAADIEIKVTELAEPNERADALVLVVGHNDDLALVGAAQRVLADILEAERKGEAGARHHLTTSIDDSRLGQAADRGLSGQRRREILRVNRQRRRRAVE